MLIVIATCHASRVYFTLVCRYIRFACNSKLGEAFPICLYVLTCITVARMPKILILNLTMYIFFIKMDLNLKIKLRRTEYENEKQK